MSWRDSVSIPSDDLSALESKQLKSGHRDHRLIPLNGEIWHYDQLKKYNKNKRFGVLERDE